ncbi:MAG: VOC family protein [Candidatus Neomarinimicrobiota bacterium]|nr:VOC family protein [Candidatus Neomarinimicrobiota bacterium]|tara:strand:+ start:62 stop:484 length:423 start_codon:yes stop_codon:yes gene_type:complete
MKKLQPFHLAFPVHDLSEAKEFYTKILGCTLGRSSEHWIDFNLFGHQVVAHLNPDELSKTKTSNVDDKQVPVRHFGIILEWEKWQQFSIELKEKGVEFIIEPYIRFKGEIGEQATMFFLDPSGNALEFKSFKDPKMIFKN